MKKLSNLRPEVKVIAGAVLVIVLMLLPAACTTEVQVVVTATPSATTQATQTPHVVTATPTPTTQPTNTPISPTETPTSTPTPTNTPAVAPVVRPTNPPQPPAEALQITRIHSYNECSGCSLWTAKLKVGVRGGTPPYTFKAEPDSPESADKEGHPLSQEEPGESLFELRFENSSKSFPVTIEVTDSTGATDRMVGWSEKPADSCACGD